MRHGTRLLSITADTVGWHDPLVDTATRNGEKEIREANYQKSETTGIAMRTIIS